MTDREKVIKWLECCGTYDENLEHVGCTEECPYYGNASMCDPIAPFQDALKLLKEQAKEIKALHLLVERAEECDFGFDQFPDEYERYKDEIKDMKYIDGMIHVAKRTLEDHGAFEEGR